MTPGHASPSGDRPRPPAVVRYAYRPLAYAGMLVIGVGIGWLAKPAGVGEHVVVEAPAVETVLIRSSGLPDAKAPRRLVRNVLALSSAFTHPTDESHRPSEHGG